MHEPQAFLNGSWIPASQAAVSVADAGFVQGATVSEQLRTFGGQLFCLDPHLDRFFRSLAVVGIELPHGRDELVDVATRLTAANHALLTAGDDLGLSIFATPGAYPTFARQRGHGPTICLHTYPLPFGQWAAKYERGESLVATDVRQVPATCWPAELKCRSRMHYYLADRAARARQPGARALLLDLEGNVSETATANLVAVVPGEGLVSPPRSKILPGISLDYLRELAEGLAIPFAQRTMTVPDLARADELLLTSTASCLLPVTMLDGQRVGTGFAGYVFSQLLAAWSERVGVDIAAQARQYSTR